MTDKRAQFVLEKARPKSEIARSRYALAKVAITVLIGTLGAAFLNYGYQNRKCTQQAAKNLNSLILQREKAEADRRQEEMKYLGEFLNYALEENYEKRMRFVEYFATLTLSPELQQKWQHYRDTLQRVLEEKNAKERELETAKKSGDVQKIDDVENELDLLRSKLNSTKNLTQSIDNILAEIDVSDPRARLKPVNLLSFGDHYPTSEVVAAILRRLESRATNPITLQGQINCFAILFQRLRREPISDEQISRLRVVIADLRKQTLKDNERRSLEAYLKKVEQTLELSLDTK